MSSTETDYLFLREFIHARSGNVLDPTRDHLFEARLHRLLQERGMHTLNDLIDRLRFAADLPLEQAVVEAMTINETSFFRDRGPFDRMQQDLVPELIEKRFSTRTLRFWSAACSSGQEAYSLAMMLRQHFPQLASWKIEIFGTDINSEMVRRAQAGRYPRMEINRGLPARLLLQYFRRDGEEWEALPDLRSICRFQQRNLSQPVSVFFKYDGILLRNVLFYFTQEMQQQILAHIHSALASDGFLLLGPAEQPAQMSLWEHIVDSRGCCYRPRVVPATSVA